MLWSTYTLRGQSVDGQLGWTDALPFPALVIGDDRDLFVHGERIRSLLRSDVEAANPADLCNVSERLVCEGPEKVGEKMIEEILQAQSTISGDLRAKETK